MRRTAANHCFVHRAQPQTPMPNDHIVPVAAPLNHHVPAAKSKGGKAGKAAPMAEKKKDDAGKKRAPMSDSQRREKRREQNRRNAVRLPYHATLRHTTLHHASTSHTPRHRQPVHVRISNGALERASPGRSQHLVNLFLLITKASVCLPFRPHANQVPVVNLFSPITHASVFPPYRPRAHSSHLRLCSHHTAHALTHRTCVCVPTLPPTRRPSAASGRLTGWVSSRKNSTTSRRRTTDSRRRLLFSSSATPSSRPSEVLLRKTS
jgi:hypothetical protein